MYIYIALHCDSKQGKSCEVSMGNVLCIVQLIKLCIEITVNGHNVQYVQYVDYYSMYTITVCTVCTVLQSLRYVQY
jgi:hypothetical protein